MTKLEEKLIELGYKQYLNFFYKWSNNWRITFDLEYYKKGFDEGFNYYISPFVTESIDRTEINKVLDILEKDLEMLKGVE